MYCRCVSYPAGCVARAGVVLRPRPVARAAVRHNAGGNLNGGVNRVGARTVKRLFAVTTLGRQAASQVEWLVYIFVISSSEERTDPATSLVRFAWLAHA